jgi:5S rRNA maturation endonuclease (ribonuclease M5)
MSVHQLEKLQRLLNDSNSTVIVEGKRDKIALSKMGALSLVDISGKSLESTIKTISLKNPESVAILTDYDKEGEKQLKILTKGLNSQGIKIDNTLRKQIKSTFNIQKIEEINSFAKLLDYGPFNCDKILKRNKFLKRMKKKKL